LDGKSLKVYLHYLALDNDHLVPEQTELQTAQNFAIPLVSLWRM